MTAPPAADAERRLPGVVRALRAVALVEGVSFVLLLVASVLKRTTGPDLVPVLGAVHGALFVGVVVLVLAALPWLRWRPLFTLLVLTVLSPGAHFPVQATVRQRHRGRQSQGSGVSGAHGAGAPPTG